MWKCWPILLQPTIYISAGVGLLTHFRVGWPVVHKINPGFFLNLECLVWQSNFCWWQLKLVIIFKCYNLLTLIATRIPCNKVLSIWESQKACGRSQIGLPFCSEQWVEGCNLSIGGGCCVSQRLFWKLKWCSLHDWRNPLMCPPVSIAAHRRASDQR